MKLSKYYKKLQVDDGVYAIYNSLIMDVIFVDNDELERIEHLLVVNRDELVILLEAGIYIYDDETDNHALELKRNTLKMRMGKVNTIYIILTNACNLRCTYCAVKNIADKEQFSEVEYLKMDVIDKFIEGYMRYAIKEAVENVDIIFYGGEPLLVWNSLAYFIQKTEKSKIKFSYSIVTNGTLLTEQMVRFCKEHGVNIGISLDGPKYINDMSRVFSTNKGSVYDIVIKNLELLKKNGVRATLSITISLEVINNKESFLDWLDIICSTYHIDAVSYNLLRFQDEEFDRITYYNNATKFIIESYQIFKGLLYEDRIGRKISSLYNQYFFHGDCAAITGNQIVLKPNGDIGVCQVFCQSEKDVLGNIMNRELEEILGDANRLKYLKMLPIFREKCLQCEAIFMCGGGCFWESSKEDNNSDIGFCTHSILMNEWLINELYQINLHS